MSSEREGPTRQEIKEGRPVQEAADRLAREADSMEKRSDELAAEIEQTRSDWERKRADESVPGANPPTSEEGVPEQAAFTHKSGDEDAEGSNLEDPPRR